MKSLKHRKGVWGRRQVELSKDRLIKFQPMLRSLIKSDFISEEGLLKGFMCRRDNSIFTLDQKATHWQQTWGTGMEAIVTASPRKEMRESWTRAGESEGEGHKPEVPKLPSHSTPRAKECPKAKWLGQQVSRYLCANTLGPAGPYTTLPTLESIDRIHPSFFYSDFVWCWPCITGTTKMRS